MAAPAPVPGPCPWQFRIQEAGERAFLTKTEHQSGPSTVVQLAPPPPSLSSWVCFFAALAGGQLPQPLGAGAQPSLCLQIRLRCQKGIPPSLRGRAWQYLSGGKVKLQQNPGRFDVSAPPYSSRAPGHLPMVAGPRVSSAGCPLWSSLTTLSWFPWAQKAASCSWSLEGLLGHPPLPPWAFGAARQEHKSPSASWQTVFTPLGSVSLGDGRATQVHQWPESACCQRCPHTVPLPLPQSCWSAVCAGACPPLPGGLGAVAARPAAAPARPHPDTGFRPRDKRRADGEMGLCHQHSADVHHALAGTRQPDPLGGGEYHSWAPSFCVQGVRGEGAGEAQAGSGDREVPLGFSIAEPRAVAHCGCLPAPAPGQLWVRLG